MLEEEVVRLTKKIVDEKRDFQDDTRIVPRADFSQINQDSLKQYLLALRLNRTNIENMTDDELIDMMGLKKDGQPTLASILTFSKYPQAVCPQLCVTAVLVPGTHMGDTTSDGKRFLANKRIEGTIAEMVDGAVNFVARNMREQVGFTARGERIDSAEYPLGAVREIILNALVHRDYSVYTEGMPVRIEMYSDRIEISNPGGLFGMVTLDMLGRVKCDVRNPTLVSILELIRVVENRFSGIPTIYSQMAEAGLPEPVFKDEKGMFTVILYNADHDKNDVAINKTQQKILDFCKTPRSRKDVAEHLEKTQYYVMKKYVEPLIAQGLLAYTKPEVPKSPNQRIYTVVEKGEGFFDG